MPVLSINLLPDGALVDILIGLGRTQLGRLRRLGQPVPAPVSLKALLDSGAECTCVDSRAASSLALDRTGISLASLPGFPLAGSTQHDAGLTIVHPSGAAFNLTIRELSLTQLALGPLGYQALIGRDVLNAYCLMVYDGPGGKVSLAY